jgi:hypothetical protein
MRAGDAMTRLWMCIVLLLSSAGLGVAQQTAPSQPSKATGQSPAASSIPTELVKPLDAKKLKPGDVVTTRTTAALRGRDLFIPSGTVILGHVVSAQARSKGNAESSLALAFDKIELTGGETLPIRGVVQAVGPNPRPEPNSGSAESGTIAAETGHDQGSTVPGPTATVGGLQPTPSEGPMLDPKGTGVLGIAGLELTKDAVLVSKAKDLKLDRGTQLMIRAQVMPKS